MSRRTTAPQWPATSTAWTFATPVRIARGQTLRVHAVPLVPNDRPNSKALPALKLRALCGSNPQSGWRRADLEVTGLPWPHDPKQMCSSCARKLGQEQTSEGLSL